MANSTRSAVSLYGSVDDDDDASDAYSMHMQLEDSQSHIATLLEMLSIENYADESIQASSMINSMEGMLGRFSDNHYDIQNEMNEMLESSRRGLLTHGQLSEMVSAESTRSQHLGNILNSLKAQIENMYDALNDLRSETESTTGTDDVVQQEIVHKSNQIVNKVDLIMKSVNAMDRIAVAPMKRLPNAIMNIDSEVVMHVNKTKLDQKEMLAAKRSSSSAAPPSGKPNQRKARKADSKSSHGSGSAAPAPPVETKSIGVGDCSIHDDAKPPESFTPVKTRLATRNAFVQTTVSGSTGMDSASKAAEVLKTSATTDSSIVSNPAPANASNAATAVAGAVDPAEGALSGHGSVDPSPRNDGQDEHHEDDGSITHDGTGRAQHKAKGGGNKGGQKGAKKKSTAKPNAGAGHSKAQGHHGGSSASHEVNSEVAAEQHDELHATTKAGGKGHGRVAAAHGHSEPGAPSTTKPTHTNPTSQHPPGPIGANTGSAVSNTTSGNIPADAIVMTPAEIEIEIKRRVKLALAAAVNKDYFAFSSAVGSKSPHSQAAFLAQSGRQLSGGFRDEEPPDDVALSLDKADRGKRGDATTTPTDIALQQAAKNAISQKTGPIESEITAATTVDAGEDDPLTEVPEKQSGKVAIKPTLDTIITPSHRKSVTIAEESSVDVPAAVNVARRRSLQLAADSSPGLPNRRKSVEGDNAADGAGDNTQLSDTAAAVAVAVANGQAHAAAAAGAGAENLNTGINMEAGAARGARGRYGARGGARTLTGAPDSGSDEFMAGFSTLEGPVLQAMPARAAPPQSKDSPQYSSSGNPFLNSIGDKRTNSSASSGIPAGRIVVPDPNEDSSHESGLPNGIDGLERDCAMSQISPCKSVHSLDGAVPSQTVQLEEEENEEGGQKAGKAPMSEAEQLRRQRYFETITDDLPDSPPSRLFHNNSFNVRSGIAAGATTSSHGPNKIDMFNQIFQSTTDPKKLAMIRIQGPESLGQRVHKGTCTSSHNDDTIVADSTVGSIDENSLESAMVTGQAMLPNVHNPISSLMNLSSSDILPSRAPPGHPAATTSRKKPLRTLKETEINAIKEALAKALDAEACSFFLSELEHVLSTQHAADARHISPAGFELPVYDNQGDILLTRTYRMPTAPATFIEILSSSDNPLLYLHQEYSSFLSKMQRTRLLNAAVLEDRVKNDLPQSQSAQLLLSKLLENMLGTVTECNEMLSMVKECEQRVQGFVDLLRRKPEQLSAIVTSMQLQELFLVVGEIEAIKVCADLKLAEYRSFLERINAQSAYELDHLIRESTDFEYTYKHFIACQAKSLEVGQRLDMILDRCRRHHLGSGSNRDKKSKKKKTKIDFDDQTSLGMGGPEAFHQEIRELQLEISNLKEQLATAQEEYEDQEVEMMEVMQEKDKSSDALLFFSVMHDPAYVNNLQQLLLQLKHLRSFADGNGHMDFITLRKRLQVCCVLTPNLEKLVDRYATMYQKWSSFRLNWFSARKLNGGSADAFNSCPLCFQCIGSPEDHTGGVSSGSPKKATTGGSVSLAITGMDRRHKRKQDQQIKQQQKQQQLQVSRSQNFNSAQEQQQQQLRLSLPHIK